MNDRLHILWNLLMIVSELTFWFGSEYKVTSNFGTPKSDPMFWCRVFWDAPLSYGKNQANPHRKHRYLFDHRCLNISRFFMKKHDFPHFSVGPVFVKLKKWRKKFFQNLKKYKHRLPGLPRENCLYQVEKCCVFPWNSIKTHFLETDTKALDTILQKIILC